MNNNHTFKISIWYGCPLLVWIQAIKRSNNPVVNPLTQLVTDKLTMVPYQGRFYQFGGENYSVERQVNLSGSLKKSYI